MTPSSAAVSSAALASMQVRVSLLLVDTGWCFTLVLIVAATDEEVTVASSRVDKLLQRVREDLKFTAADEMFHKRTMPEEQLTRFNLVKTYCEDILNLGAFGLSIRMFSYFHSFPYASASPYCGFLSVAMARASIRARLFYHPKLSSMTARNMG